MQHPKLYKVVSRVLVEVAFRAHVEYVWNVTSGVMVLSYVCSVPALMIRCP